MKLILLLAILLAVPLSARAENAIFYGPTVGATSFSTSAGNTNRESDFSYGAEGFVVRDHFAGGLSYRYFSPGQQGTQAINLTQNNHWANAEFRYRIWNLNFSPYVSAGAGALFQSVSTTVLGSTEQTNGVFFIQDLGAGIMGRITGQFGVNLSARYYQFSNVNGFDYYISVGFFPDF